MQKRELSRADALLMALAVLLTVGAGMGEWKVVNAVLGGLPKIVSLGVPGVALLCFLVRADFAHMRRCMAFLAMYLLYIVALMVWTLAIWTHNLTELPSIVRGMSKLLYQGFGIAYAIGFVYLCRERAIDCFFAGMVITNALIALLEIPGYGLAASLRSVITCILTFGDAQGYVRALEIHDVTFLFGQFFVYYAALAPRGNAKERRACLIKAVTAMFFMLLGLKRTAIPGAMLWAVYAAFVLRRRHPLRFVMATSVAMIAFFWAYLIAIRMGLFSAAMKLLGIDPMGRDYIWGLASPYYSLSPAFTGRGFEAVDAIVSQWYHEGILNHPYPFHNDILKVYVELGFGGCMIGNFSPEKVMQAFDLPEHLVPQLILALGKPQETILLATQATQPTPYQPATDGGSIFGVLIVLIVLTILATLSLLFRAVGQGRRKKKRRHRR